ncbi:MAG: dTDP-4-dehydrorhamnose 3,5-epimerase, partial [Solirubrobacterales bacterium]|nr:dTDP-4-dehydrorhamnose 3,5-epimerase [Solirubrobacterales bacterium]
DDPEVGVQWPLMAAEIQVSARDATGPSLADVSAALPFTF